MFKIVKLGWLGEGNEIKFIVMLHLNKHASAAVLYSFKDNPGPGVVGNLTSY